MPEFTPQQFAKWLKNYPDRLSKEVAKAESATLRKAKSRALRWSSGGRSARRLRLMGHPYAKGFAGRFSGDLALINKQTGTFRSVWSIQPPSTSLNRADIVSKLVNTAPYAVYLSEGTSKMKARPFVDRIIAEIEPFRIQQIEKAIERAWYGR